MNINDILGKIPMRVKLGLTALAFASTVSPLMTSPHYDEPRKPGEFRQPEFKPVDYVPAYGVYTNISRWKGIESLSEFIDYHLEGLSQDTMLQILTVGTANWPHENFGEELKTAANNSLFLGYHTIATVPFIYSPLIIYGLIRKRNQIENQPTQA